MEEVPCVHCGTFFVRRNKKQNYSPLPDCQKARKAAWQRHQLRTNPEYRENQKISNRKWQRNNPDYWKQYRRNNPDKATRNRALQRLRNTRRAPPDKESPKRNIAKMDATKRRTHGLSGQYWLIPLIAKMDVRKIYIHAIPDG